MPRAIHKPERKAMRLANEHLAAAQQHGARIGVRKGYDAGFHRGLATGIAFCWVAFFTISFFVWLFW